MARRDVVLAVGREIDKIVQVNKLAIAYVILTDEGHQNSTVNFAGQVSPVVMTGALVTLLLQAIGVKSTLTDQVREGGTP